MSSIVSDLWHWKVTHNDGSVVHEYDPDGTEHGWKDVRVSQVFLVELLPQRADLPVHRLEVQRDHYPIFWRRRYISVSQDGSTSLRSTVHLLGMEHEPERGVYLFLFSDGNTMLTDNFNAV